MQLAYVSIMGRTSEGVEEFTRASTGKEGRDNLKDYRENTPGQYWLKYVYWESIRRWVRQKYNALRETQQFSGAHPSHAASEALRLASAHFEIGHGSEGFCDDVGRHGYSYINTGDPYETTVLFDSESERFSVGNWGDIVENAPEGRYP